jgi:hypothetical protein
MIITSLYGMATLPNKEHENKLKAAIQYLGNRYLLATPIKKEIK